MKLESVNDMEKTSGNMIVVNVIGDINKVIKEKRINLSLTLDDLSKKTGIPKSTISAWETGRRKLRNIESIKRLCDGLGIEYIKILSETQIGAS